MRKEHRRPIADPHRATAGNFAFLRTVPVFPPQLLLSGLFFDEATGEIAVAAPPAPVRLAAWIVAGCTPPLRKRVGRGLCADSL